jgi:hypothetical protein
MEIDFNQDPGLLIKTLKQKSIDVPAWSRIEEEYEPMRHKILFDHTRRMDKVLSNKKVEKAARIAIGLEKLHAHRIADFAFAKPVKRTYLGSTDEDKDIINAMEAIYKKAHINNVNKKRGLAYFASCEICTIWYAVPKPGNADYGFSSDWKLKCKTYSPMDGVSLYPYIDEVDDMFAMSFEYQVEGSSETVTYFETYTQDRHVKWREDGNDYKVLVDEKIIIGKIPAIYLYRDLPIFAGLSGLREEMEYEISEERDVIAYNSAPILKVSGAIQGEPVKGETRRVVHVESGGDVGYVSWAQSTEASKNNFNTLKNLYWSQAQLPDISFENMKGLGNIGYDARQTLFADAKLKVEGETGDFVEFLEREGNVLKAFLKVMNPEWAKRLDEIEIEHTINVYDYADQKSQIEIWTAANGGKALISQRESIEKAGLTQDSYKTYDDIQNEEGQAAEARVNSIMEGGV